ncbi:MAG: ribulose-phosphate 3-epimerase [Christensenella sp.]|uniref:ribulose-phosphate 3-epimerase n=1 Tax=Christensenella sp. TaxID=1935934 RepID=UPI002B1F7819|nr:ribulose-phosphate 3-epimerase [Christensenella sp.]MEA5001969.1 ribulose-phosphate 3-epimerase [Christensenella sp.]
MHKIAATILTCNNAFLGQAVLAAQRGGADQLHVDIIDGRYASNFSFGPKTIADLKEVVDIPIEVHFELYDPQYYIDMFAEAGADMMTIQMDGCACPIQAVSRIKRLGKQVGVGLKPTERVESIEYIAHHLDYLIMMSVEPGFGGQKLEESIYTKIGAAKKMFAEQGLDIPIYIDGSVNQETAPKLLASGADVLIIGSSVFSSNKVTDAEIEAGMQHFKSL